MAVDSFQDIEFQAAIEWILNPERQNIIWNDPKFQKDSMLCTKKENAKEELHNYLIIISVIMGIISTIVGCTM